jgi:hypothetical protein
LRSLTIGRLGLARSIKRRLLPGYLQQLVKGSVKNGAKEDLGRFVSQQRNCLSQKTAKDTKTKLGHKGAAPGTTPQQRSDGSQSLKDGYLFVIFVASCANVPRFLRAQQRNHLSLSMNSSLSGVGIDADSAET